MLYWYSVWCSASHSKVKFAEWEGTVEVELTSCQKKGDDLNYCPQEYTNDPLTSANQPYGSLGLRQDTASTEYCDLGIVSIKIMVTYKGK